jgi:hypothetical protein
MTHSSQPFFFFYYRLHQLLHQELFANDAQPAPLAAGQPLLLPNGTKERPFQSTTKWDSSDDKQRMDLQSITGMSTYQHYSFEELRLQDLMQVIRGNSPFGIPSFVSPTPTSSWVVSSSATEIPFAGAAGSYSEMGSGLTHYFDSITGMTVYMNKSCEELRLEYLIAGRVAANSGLEAVFDALDVGGERMSDGTSDQESAVVLQSIPYNMMSFEEIRFQDVVDGRTRQSPLYSFPHLSFEEIRFQDMAEERRY